MEFYMGGLSMDMLAKFKQFLIDNECLESYLYNLKKFNTDFNYSPADQFIIYAFHWIDTPEGASFWNTLSSKWKHEIIDYKNEDYYYFTDIIEYLSEDSESLWTD